MSQPDDPAPKAGARRRRRRIVLSVILLLLLALVTWCLIPETGGKVRGLTTIQDLFLKPDSPRYFVTGHRGDFFRWRLILDDNNIGSFTRAIAQGADMVELDISNTKDGTLVVIHSIVPRERTIDEWRARGREYLLFDDVLDWAKGKVVLMLDMKTKLYDRVVDAVRRHDAFDRVLFLAGRVSIYQALKKVGGDDPWVMTRPRKPKDLLKWIEEDDKRVIAIHGDMDWLTPELIRAVHDSGRLVFANSYRATWHQEALGAESSAREYFKAGINIVQTNCPASACRARDEAEAGARVAAAR